MNSGNLQYFYWILKTKQHKVITQRQIGASHHLRCEKPIALQIVNEKTSHKKFLKNYFGKNYLKTICSILQICIT